MRERGGSGEGASGDKGEGNGVGRAGEGAACWEEGRVFKHRWSGLESRSPRPREEKPKKKSLSLYSLCLVMCLTNHKYSKT